MSAEHRLSQKMGPQMKRMLIVDPAPASQRLLADLLRNCGGGEMWQAATTAAAMRLAAVVDPMIIFTELAGDGLDGLELARLIRRSHLACREAPVIMVTAVSTAQAIFAARDAGVHEFLRKPYTIRDLQRRLEAVTQQPRDWIEGIAYIGPDRRRFNSGDYGGPRKRRTDAQASPHEARVIQAMKIVRAAVAAIETDPMQAVRALRAQADDLQILAAATADRPLATAAAAMRSCVDGADQNTPVRALLDAHVRALWSVLPAQMEAEALASQLAA